MREKEKGRGLGWIGGLGLALGWAGFWGFAFLFLSLLFLNFSIPNSNKV
jgi:hypothetical protein